jgi:hypothetical protein
MQSRSSSQKPLGELNLVRDIGCTLSKVYTNSLLYVHYISEVHDLVRILYETYDSC